MAVVITALLWATFGSTTASHAVESPATWKGSSILYAGHQYFVAPAAEAGNSLGLAQGTQYYVYTPDNSGNPQRTIDAFVIYFAPGADPPKEKSATFVSYTFTPSTKIYSNPVKKQTIEVTPQGSEDAFSSCTIQGIGWIICPITVFLSEGMDWIFNMVKGFLLVQPPNVSNPNNDLYTAWNVMRSIANVAFIIVFLIIIYSQLTNLGVTNYGLKKLLPRLIIAAVLVNMSYIICAIAVDISNILGYSMQDIFNGIRRDTFNITNDTWQAWDSDTMGWSAVTAFVLSGGAASLGILVATGGTAASAVYLLIPLLLGFILTILVVLLILAGRQAIIVLLIVVAPLAFVAYLLPNTEQWFKKWRELFMTMLVFFPAFSLVFGGAQLAGGIIIQNATTIVMVIFGLAVQVAPLIVTPLLLKLSGGLLGKIAGLVNDPKKGLLDRTKNWSGARAEMHRQRGISNANLRRNQIFRRAARGLALNNDRVERNTSRYKNEFEAMATERAVSTRKGQKIEVQSALAKAKTEDLNKNLGLAMEELKAGDASGLDRLRMLQGATTMEKLKITASDGQTTLEDLRITNVQGTRRGKSQAKFAAAVVKRAEELDAESRAIENATAIARNVQLTNYAKQIELDTNGLRVKAGGIAGERGQDAALSAAFKAQSAAHGEAVANAQSIMGHYNYGDDVIVNVAQGKTDGTHFTKISAALQEAAITKIAGGGNADAILKLMESIEINPSEENQDFRQAFADALLTNSAKPKFAGAGIIAQIKQGQAPASGKARIDTFVAQTINADKLSSADTLVGQDRDYLEAVLKTLNNNESSETISAEAKIGLLKSIDEMRANPIYSGRIGERRNALRDIERRLRQDTGVAPPAGAPDPFADDE
jgi:hypothetical protein